MKTRESTPTQGLWEAHVLNQVSAGSRSRRTEMIFTDRVSADSDDPPHDLHWQSQGPTTPYSHLRQCADRRPSRPNQFAVSCHIYLYEYAPIYIRCIAFAWHVCIPEHYRCSLMRDLRDVHRPATRRFVDTQPCTFPSAAHQYRTPNTHRTNTCLQSHTAKPQLQKQL